MVAQEFELLFRRFTTLSEAVERSPEYLADLWGDYCRPEDGRDGHISYFLWGPDDAGTMRLYRICSDEDFEAKELPHGTHTLPELLSTPLPAKLTEPMRQLPGIVAGVHQYITERDGPNASGGAMVFLSQRAKHFEFQLLDSLPEAQPAEAEVEEAAPEASTVQPLWRSFNEYRAFLAECYTLRRQRECPGMSRAERRLFAKEATKEAAKSRDVWAEIKDTPADQHIHADTMLSWVRQVGATAH